MSVQGTFDGDRSGHCPRARKTKCSNLCQGSWKVQCFSDNWEEFSAATAKPPAKATQAAQAKYLFAGVSSVCTKENHKT